MNKLSHLFNSRDPDGSMNPLRVVGATFLILSVVVFVMWLSHLAQEAIDSPAPKTHCEKLMAVGDGYLIYCDKE